MLDLYQHLIAQDQRCPPETAQRIFESFSSYAGSSILLGEFGSTLVATCTVIVVPNLARGGVPFALIENVVTHFDFRNRGFGKAILAAAAELAWAKGYYKVMLMTGSKKPETVAFYHSAGFERTKTAFEIRRIGARPQ